MAGRSKVNLWLVLVVIFKIFFLLILIVGNTYFSSILNAVVLNAQWLHTRETITYKGENMDIPKRFAQTLRVDHEWTILTCVHD